VRERLALRCDPYDAALALRGDRRPVALIGDWLGSGALLASEPLVVAEPGDDPFALLACQPRAEAGAEGVGVGGGWMGTLGYDLGRRLEPVPAPPPRPLTRAPFALGFYDHLLRRDARGTWWFEALWSPARDRALRRRRAQLLERLAGAARRRPFRVGAFSPRAPGLEGHHAAIEECRERIAAGEVFQANLCLRLDADWAGDPLDLLAAAGARLRPRYAALVGDEDGAVVSLSPELFLRRRGRTATSEPIKGTAARAGDGDGGRSLGASAKDRAENVMIVDLMRNDLGRVAAYGSVRVDALAEPRPHPGLWHLVSTVSATLREGVDDGELVRAAFPPGSVTGAPKVQAMRVIAELEATAREAYTGAIGVASPIAGLELSVAIRTFEVRGDAIWLGVGGGIVADSDPDAEVAECLAKAAPLVAAAGSRLEAGPPVPRRAASARALPRALALARAGRPDPAHGVFTSALVGAGDEEALAWHLDRLAASARELYGGEPAPGWRERVAAVAARATAPARLRVDVVPRRQGPPVAEASLGAVPARADAPLRPVLLPGGLGAHKWRDRRLVDELALALDGVPLLVDADGCVLEAGHAAVLLREGDDLVAAPPERALLPSLGVRALDGVRHEPFDLDRARRADAILLVSALRGPRAARLEP
jgi:para-aminobenzoate synthetase/4-amino-4-deoxychorismate lyase